MLFFLVPEGGRPDRDDIFFFGPVWYCLVLFVYVRGKRGWRVEDGLWFGLVWFGLVCSEDSKKIQNPLWFGTKNPIHKGESERKQETQRPKPRNEKNCPTCSPAVSSSGLDVWGGGVL